MPSPNFLTCCFSGPAEDGDANNCKLESANQPQVALPSAPTRFGRFLKCIAALFTRPASSSKEQSAPPPAQTIELECPTTFGEITLDISPTDSPRYWRFLPPEVAQFFDACGRNDVHAVVRCHQRNNGIVEHYDEKGHSALHFAAIKGNIEVLNLLVEVCNMDPNRNDIRGRRVIVSACAEGQLDVVRYLVEECQVIDLNEPGDDGITPLYAAASAGHLEVVKYLVDGVKTWVSGAEVIPKADPKVAVEIAGVQITPQLAAQQKGRTEVYQFLLERNGDENIVNKETPASASECVEVKAAEPWVVLQPESGCPAK